jgi:hypothetical protein
MVVLLSLINQQQLIQILLKEMNLLKDYMIVILVGQ